MKKLLIVCLALTATLALGGCGKTYPIYSVNDFPTPAVTTEKAMQKAILEAGSLNGWEMTVIKPGLIEGVNKWGNGKHAAVVSIPYSATHYSILYKSSVNLKAAKGKIHRTYNRLVQDLDNNIRSRIETDAALARDAQK